MENNDLVVVKLPENERFVEINDDGEADFVDETEANPNSSKQTRWGVSIFKEWLYKRFPSEILEELNEITLSERLSVFYQELKLKCNQDRDYSRSAIISIRAAINRHLTSKEVGKEFSIIRDSTFRLANKSLNAKLKKIQENGTCAVNHHKPMRPEDIRKCFQYGIFGEKTPISLLRVNWFNISIFFCRRGRRNYRNLKKTSFVFKKDNDTEFVEFSEDEKAENRNCGIKSEETDSKMFATGTEHCPVAYFKKFLSVLNPGEPALFQKPRRNFVYTDAVWYEKSALGINALGGMMKEISAAAYLSQAYTNQSIRATSFSVLGKSGIPAYRGRKDSSGNRNEGSDDFDFSCVESTPLLGELWMVVTSAPLYKPILPKPPMDVLSQVPSQVPSQAPSQVPIQLPSRVTTRVTSRVTSRVHTQVPLSQVPSKVIITTPARSKESFGVDPVYNTVNTGYKVFQYKQPFYFQYNKGVIPEMTIAYETWGKLNETKSNVILLFTGLSPSSHARSHEDNPSEGWWEKFIGPSCALDTDKFFIICCNVIGGCYGSSGPSSISPVTKEPYATTFPVVSVQDMVKAQFLLLDSLGIEKLHAAVGSSLGGMLSLTAACLYPERVNRLVSISACAQSHPTSIAMRYVQRRILMSDPNWNKGFYYNTGAFPRLGMKHAREVGTITYRSGPEWEERFGRKRIDHDAAVEPNFCPEFEIESYLDYQGDSFCVKYDPNSLLYISKAMDLFDLGEGFDSLLDGVSRIKCPTLVLGVQSDVLFPISQQRELEKLLQDSGNHSVTFYELNSIYGHDTFLLDVVAVGAAVKGHLETDLKINGKSRKDKR